MLLLACLFMGISHVTAQTSTVTGIVTSEEDGEPVIGASVLVLGTSLGTVTDVDGRLQFLMYQVLQRTCVFLLLECRLKMCQLSVVRFL